MKPRVRFAPSPTGYLHIGGARTALFNWLYARRTGGVFILRMEDTDQVRSTPESVQAILDGLTWLGMDWDEGPGKDGAFGPYFQTKRLGSYAKHADALIAQGKAYRCYCTKEELDARRKKFEENNKGAWKYDGHCRDEKAALELASRPLSSADAENAALVQQRMQSLNQGLQSLKHRPAVLRFKMPRGDGSFSFDDQVLGRISKTWDDLDDFVMQRADGIPLYNFGCVVDDHEMQVTLVGRGQEHVNSTFPQLALYAALEWSPPQFAHFPLILGPDREKLSKRKHPEADVMLHKNNGVLPEALLNFVARLGWSHGNDEVITVKQMTEWFDFDAVGKTSGVWNPEKLTWLNQQYLKLLPIEDIAARVAPFLPVPVGADDPRLRKLVGAFRERSKTLVEMAEKTTGYFKKGVTIDAAAAAKHLDASGKAALAQAAAALESAEWNAAKIDEALKKLAEATGLKMGAIAQPIRVAVTGNTTSPGIGETLELLGRDEALARIAQALK